MVSLHEPHDLHKWSYFGGLDLGSKYSWYAPAWRFFVSQGWCVHPTCSSCNYAYIVAAVWKPRHGESHLYNSGGFAFGHWLRGFPARFMCEKRHQTPDTLPSHVSVYRNFFAFLLQLCHSDLWENACMRKIYSNAPNFHAYARKWGLPEGNRRNMLHDDVSKQQIAKKACERSCGHSLKV